MPGKILCESCGGPNAADNNFCTWCNAPMGRTKRTVSRLGGYFLQEAEKKTASGSPRRKVVKGRKRRVVRKKVVKKRVVKKAVPKLASMPNLLGRRSPHGSRRGAASPGRSGGRSPRHVGSGPKAVASQTAVDLTALSQRKNSSGGGGGNNSSGSGGGWVSPRLRGASSSPRPIESASPRTGITDAARATDADEILAAVLSSPLNESASVPQLNEKAPKEEEQQDKKTEEQKKTEGDNNKAADEPPPRPPPRQRSPRARLSKPASLPVLPAGGGGGAVSPRAAAAPPAGAPKRAVVVKRKKSGSRRGGGSRKGAKSASGRRRRRKKPVSFKGPACGACGKKQPHDGFLFCKFCGKPMAKEGETPVVTSRFCAKCGSTKIDKFTGRVLSEENAAQAKETVCPKCDAPPLPSGRRAKGRGLPSKAAFGKDQRRTIRLDASLAAIEGNRLKKTRGTLLFHAMRDVNSKAKQAAPQRKIEWEDLEIEREVGEGAYAIVYVGEWKGKRVAIKEMKFEQADAQTVKDFKMEVAVLTCLQHPNITAFYGGCLKPERLAYVMEYAEHGSLSMLLVRDDIKLDWKQRIKWAMDIGSALAYLHSRKPKIIHRDLKSDNILVAAEYRAKICDFGLCKAKVVGTKPMGGGGMDLRRSQQRKSFQQQRLSVVQFSAEVGTPAYTAPELWKKVPYTERVDVYSYGILLWELLERDWAHSDIEDPEEIMVRVRTEGLRPTIPEWCPKHWKHLMELCWHERPERRPLFPGVLRLLNALLKQCEKWEPAANTDPMAAYEEEMKRRELEEAENGAESSEEESLEIVEVIEEGSSVEEEEVVEVIEEEYDDEDSSEVVEEVVIIEEEDDDDDDDDDDDGKKDEDGAAEGKDSEEGE